MKKTHKISTIAAIAIVAQSLILTIGCLLVADAFFRRSIMATYDEMGESIVSAVTAGLESDDLAQLCEAVDSAYRDVSDDLEKEDVEKEADYYEHFREIEESDVYARVRSLLDEARWDTNSTAIDIMLLYPEEDMGVYIMDSCDTNILPCGEVFHMNLNEFEDNPGARMNSRIFFSPTYGSVSTSGIAVHLNEKTGTYAYITADFPLTYLVDKGVLFLIQTAAVAIIITIAACIITTAFIRRRVVVPLHVMTDTAVEFVDDYEERADSRNESHIFESVDGGKIKEFHNLASSLQSMELEMNAYLKDLNSLIEERTRISTELNLASSIQEGLLPSGTNIYSGRKDFDLHASMVPAKEVGGDFYDYFLIGKDHIGLVMADVSGKGVPAAILMALVKTLIKNRLLGGDGPAEALKKVNDQISANNPNNMFITVWAAKINLSTGRWTEVNAGHEYSYVGKKGGAYEKIRYKHDIALGIREGISFNEHGYELGHGDMLFVYTDGITEATSTKKELFGDERLKKALNKAGDQDPKELIETVGEEVRDFVGAEPQFDDITMMAFRRN